MRNQRKELSRYGWRCAATLLLLLTAVSCRLDAPSGGGSDNDIRFVFLRGKQALLRLDTATGTVWTSTEGSDAGWIELGETPDAGDLAQKNGRYGIFSMTAGRAGGPAGLLRVDRFTGEAWLGTLEEGMSWRRVEPSGDDVVEEADATEAVIPSGTPPAPGAQSDAKPQALPLISRDDMLEAAGGTEAEKLAVVVEALRKKELSVEIRVWAATQLSVFDPDVAVPPLLATLDDQEPEVVVAAITSLQQLGDPTAIPRVQAMASHPDPRVRQAVSQVIKPLPQ